MQTRRLAAAITLSLIGIILCAWLWERTGDILGDFGHELYVPWQLSQGKIIGRDVAYLYGPLSPWINGVLFRIFGAGLNVLLIGNLLVVIGATILIYRLVLAASSELAAFVATAFFLIVFGLSAPTEITNYNFLTPYAHGVTHGLLLCLGTAGFLSLYHRSGKVHWAAAAGLLCGAAFLTKPEMFVACAATLIAGLAGTRKLRGALAASAAVLVFPAIAFGVLLISMPPATALSTWAGGWQFVTAAHVSASPMHVAGLGLDNIAESLRAIGLSALVDVAALLALIILAKTMPSWIAPLPAVGLCAIVIAAGQYFPGYWIDAERAYVPLALGAAAIFGWRLFRSAPDQRRWSQWVLSVLSLSLLVKMFLNVRTYQYGFVLAAPCAMLLVAALVDWLPAAIARRGGSARVAALSACGILAGLAVNRLVISTHVLSERTLQIPLAMGGTISARPIDQPAAAAVLWLRQLPAQTTVAIYPDAAGIDFAAGKSSGLRDNVLNPMTLSMWGEQIALGDCKRHPPDVILLVRTDAGQLGAHWFGADYGRDVMAWITANYAPAVAFGDAAAERSIVVWKRIENRD